MEEDVIDSVADAWIAYQRGVIDQGQGFHESQAGKTLWPLFSQFADWALDDPEATWAVVVAIWNRIDHQDLRLVGLLGAGEVEDLLARFGDDYFPVIEQFCEVEPEFKTVLRMVWQNSMSPELWQKVQDLRGGPNL